MLPTSYALESYTRAHMDRCLADAAQQRASSAARPTPCGARGGRAPWLVGRVLAVGIPRVRPPRPIGALTIR
jgi:hypothetical protein